MEKELFNDLMESCQQALEYVKGDKTKGREVIITIPDVDIIEMYNKLSEDDKQKAMNYIIELLKVSSK